MSDQTKPSAQQTRTAILRVLNDGQFHSGEMLASEFALSRSAISNHVKALTALGVEIFSVKGRGYQLATPLELLSQSDICAQLPRDKHTLIAVENVVTSTNDLLKQGISDAKSGQVVMAEAQSAGRGRRGRAWVSPFGSSLYFSMLWHFEHGYQAMSGLSLMVGVVLNNTLKQHGVEHCQLKWPNDVYFNAQKLAGILVEVDGQVGASATAIIGIGVNIQLPDNVKGIDQAFTDLAHINSSVSRNALAASLTQNLWDALATFEQSGLRSFIPAWQQADLYINKPVKLLLGERSVEGVSKGIDHNGALLLETPSGIMTYHGGEISVRPR